MKQSARKGDQIDLQGGYKSLILHLTSGEGLQTQREIIYQGRMVSRTGYPLFACSVDEAGMDTSVMEAQA